MVLYKDPEFRRLPATLASIFDAAAADSFFSLPEWYDLMARVGVPSGTNDRVFATENQSPGAAIVLRVAHEESYPCLTSLLNVYSVEHGVLGPNGNGIDGSLGTILDEIWGQRPRLTCL